MPDNETLARAAKVDAGKAGRVAEAGKTGRAPEVRRAKVDTDRARTESNIKGAPETSRARVDAGTKSGLTAPEAAIQRQIATAGPKDARSTGILKAEQPIREEIPSTATIVRGYAKWTDNDGNFRKVALDGTTAVRAPAHEQHEVTVEDRDRLDQALALKTPRRDVKGAKEVAPEDVLYGKVHDVLAGRGVEAAPIEEGKVDDGEGFKNAVKEVRVGTGADEAE